LISAPVRNALTIDVEDYFQVSVFDRHIGRESWDLQPCRLERNMECLLSMLAKHRVVATFFVLGWVAQRYPGLVRSIVQADHELASHGYSHRRASEQNRPEFFEDISHAKCLLEDVSGTAVKGYRAPSFSIDERNFWALKCIADAGYVYSSSIYPIHHDLYGMPAAPRFMFQPGDSDGLLELPLTTVRILNHNFPAGGGGYFRLLPYRFSRWCLKRVNNREGQPCIFYFHPWELDPDQPRQNGVGLKTRFRHYTNLKRMKPRIEALLSDFQWDRVDRIFLQDPS
jgi:polysaccharide deacetylase family protein (PEP-CTERM system associated)